MARKLKYKQWKKSIKCSQCKGPSIKSICNGKRERSWSIWDSTKAKNDGILSQFILIVLKCAFVVDPRITKVIFKFIITN